MPVSVPVNGILGRSVCWELDAGSKVAIPKEWCVNKYSLWHGSDATVEAWGDVGHSSGRTWPAAQ